jgi:hypothetical protein
MRVQKKPAPKKKPAVKQKPIVPSMTPPAVAPMRGEVQPLRVRWDYCVLLLPSLERQEEPLSRYGEQGWELVSVLPEPPHGGLPVAYFKRPRGE